MPRPALLRRLVLPIVLGSFLSTCTDAEVPDRPTMVTAAVDTTLRLEHPPILSLGGIDEAGPEQFSAITTAVPLPGGHVVLGDVNDGDVDHFRISDGAHLGRWARSGDGPGEVRSVIFAQLVPPDTVIVYDLEPSRFTIFREGEVVSTHQLSDPFVEVAGVESTEFAWLYFDSPGSAWDAEGIFPGSPFWVRRVRIRDGTVVDSIGPIPGRAEFKATIGRSHIGFEPPFTPRSAVAARDSLVVVARHEDGALDVYVNGELARSVRLPIQARPVDEALMEEWVDQRAPREGNWRTAHRMALEEATLPEYAPLMDDVLISSDHAIWVQEYGRPGGHQRWWRLREAWERIDLPARARFLAATDSTVILGTLGEFDVSLVQVHRILR